MADEPSFGAGQVSNSQSVLATAVRLLDQDIHNRLALGELGRVDKVGRAHRAGPLLLARVRVDRDDLLRLADAAALDDGEADGAEAKDGDVVALLDVGRLGAVPGSLISSVSIQLLGTWFS